MCPQHAGNPLLTPTGRKTNTRPRRLSDNNLCKRKESLRGRGEKKRRFWPLIGRFLTIFWTRDHLRTRKFTDKKFSFFVIQHSADLQLKIIRAVWILRSFPTPQKPAMLIRVFNLFIYLLIYFWRRRLRSTAWNSRDRSFDLLLSRYNRSGVSTLKLRILHYKGKRLNIWRGAREKISEFWKCCSSVGRRSGKRRKNQMSPSEEPDIMFASCLFVAGVTQNRRLMPLLFNLAKQWRGLLEFHTRLLFKDDLLRPSGSSVYKLAQIQ